MCATARRKRGGRSAIATPSPAPTAAESRSPPPGASGGPRPRVGGGAGLAHELGHQGLRLRCLPVWIGNHGQAQLSLGRRRVGARTDRFVGQTFVTLRTVSGPSRVTTYRSG